MLYDLKWEVPLELAPPTEPWRQALLDAADLLEKHGWCQGAWRDGERWCAHGALLEVTDDHQAEYEARVRFRKFTSDMRMDAWNDVPGRTVEEVTAMLRKVAKCD